MRLAELERAVQEHMLAGGALPEALAHAVAPPAEERWQIYTDGYRLRLIEALSLQYPALHARLGAEAFAVAVEPFVVATPSVHRSIRDYGSELGTFLRTAGDDVEAALLADLAEFEWALAGAFDAAEARAATSEDLATLAPADWASLRFGPVPSLRRSRTTTNAVQAWRATQEASAAGRSPAATATPALEWLIWRRGSATEFRSIEPDEAAALELLFGGGNFGELCESLFNSHGDQAPARAAGWLKGWLLEGSLVRV